MNHLSLFSGIGGIDLAAEWAGFETVAFCEQDKYCQKILSKHWPGIPIYDDIRTLTAKSLADRNITLITGGFPCQPFSHAGKRKGEDDNRYLWPEMLRVIREVRPTWVCGENVAGIISMALDTVQTDLETEGYETQAFVLPACAVNAPHRRDRVFIVAHTIRQGLEIRQRLGRNNEQEQPAIKRSGENVPNPTNNQLTRGRVTRTRWSELADGSRWSTQSDLGMLADGVPNRVAKLKALGNAVVPQQVYPILKAIADYELNYAT